MYIGEFNVEPHSELYKNKQIRTEFQGRRTRIQT